MEKEEKKSQARYFGLIGHVKIPPDITRIRSILEYVGLAVKFYRFSETPVYIVNQDPRAARK